MGQRLLSLMLAGATVIGPMFCCCAIAPASNAGQVAVDKTALNLTVSDPRVESCPCSRKAPTPKEKDHRRDCPCKKVKQANPSTIVAGRELTDAFWNEVNFHWCDVVVSRSCNRCWIDATRALATEFESCTFPYATGRDILRAFHILQR